MNTRLEKVIGGVMPFLLAEVAVSALLIAFPGIVTAPLAFFAGAAR